MFEVQREATQGIFQRENMKSHFVEEKLKQGARDAPTVLMCRWAQSLCRGPFMTL